MILVRFTKGQFRSICGGMALLVSACASSGPLPPRMTANGPEEEWPDDEIPRREHAYGADRPAPTPHHASKNGGSDETVRVLFTALAAAGLTDFAKDANKNSDPLSKSAAILARRVRANIISDAIRQSFPELAPLEVRTVTRIVGLILDGNLTAENLSEQTIRGEILTELKSKGGETEWNAEVVNFLYLLARSYR